MACTVNSMKTNASFFSLLLFVFLKDVFWNILYFYMLQHSKGKNGHTMESQPLSYPIQFPSQKATTLTSFLSILHKP